MCGVVGHHLHEWLIKHREVGLKKNSLPNLSKALTWSETGNSPKQTDFSAEDMKSPYLTLCHERIDGLTEISLKNSLVHVKQQRVKCILFLVKFLNFFFCLKGRLHLAQYSNHGLEQNFLRERWWLFDNINIVFCSHLIALGKFDDGTVRLLGELLQTIVIINEVSFLPLLQLHMVFKFFNNRLTQILNCLVEPLFTVSNLKNKIK